MEQAFYNQLAKESIVDEIPSRQVALEILISDKIELLPLLNAAFEVRKKFMGKEVEIHIINNAQNGYCPENCRYCAQSKTSQADIEEYPLKSDDEIFSEARNAYENGAFRYCVVFAGRSPSSTRVAHIARLVREIKKKYPSLEVCVSAGLLDEEKALVLKEAGLDRLNHNLNTSARHYSNVCTTHTYADRLNTLAVARRAGIHLCSGMIIGIGETPEDILDVVCTLRELRVESIPINFYMPIEGNLLSAITSPVSGQKRVLELSPEYCLRVLCLFRFFNPKSEIRVAAGRELYLRDMQVMALYPANSLFLDGYLNAKGDKRRRTLQMIKDAGFTIRSECSIDDVLARDASPVETEEKVGDAEISLKKAKDLRQTLSSIP